MKIRINGKTEEVQVATVEDLLTSKNIEPQMVSVEVNAALIERDAYKSTRLGEGDQVEFLFFMGGGR